MKRKKSNRMRTPERVQAAIKDYDFQDEIEEMVGEMNSIGFHEIKNRVGEIPMNLEINGKQAKAQIQIIITIEESEFI